MFLTFIVHGKFFLGLRWNENIVIGKSFLTWYTRLHGFLEEDKNTQQDQFQYTLFGFEDNRINSFKYRVSNQRFGMGGLKGPPSIYGCFKPNKTFLCYY